MNIEFSERSKLELECIIKKLNDNTFNEDDIKSLLLQWRAYFKSSSLIWEFACFISHPEERDKGIFHKELDVRYAKMIYGKAIGGPFNKTFNPNVIEQKLFNTLLIGGIETINIEYLKKQTGLTVFQSKELINRSYEKKGKIYHIKSQKNHNKLEKIINSILSLTNFTASINNKDIIDQFHSALEETINILNINFNTDEIIKKNKNKILICLMCLLHSHNFILFDNNKGNCRLEINTNKDNKWTLYLYANVLNISWPLMEIDEELESHIENLPEVNIFGERFKLNGFNAIRNSQGQLVITNKNDQILTKYGRI